MACFCAILQDNYLIPETFHSELCGDIDEVGQLASRQGSRWDMEQKVSNNHNIPHKVGQMALCA